MKMVIVGDHALDKACLLQSISDFVRPRYCPALRAFIALSLHLRRDSDFSLCSLSSAPEREASDDGRQSSRYEVEPEEMRATDLVIKANTRGINASTNVDVTLSALNITGYTSSPRLMSEMMMRVTLTHIAPVAAGLR
jgi:hypothetical protein